MVIVEKEVVVLVVCLVIYNLAQERAHLNSGAVNVDSPDVDRSKGSQKEVLVDWVHEHEEVVWGALESAIEGSEGVGSEGGRDKPLVVLLVNVLVDPTVVETTVDPVDETIVPHDVCEDTPDVKKHTALVDVVKEKRHATDFSQEEGHIHGSHDGDGLDSSHNLHINLVL